MPETAVPAPILGQVRRPAPPTTVALVVPISARPVRRDLRQMSAYSAHTTTLSSGNGGGRTVDRTASSADNESGDMCGTDVICCGVHWYQAGRIYLLIGGILGAVGIVTLLATAIGHNGPVWIGPIIVCVGLLLLGKGIFDYVRYRVKAGVDRPDNDPEDLESAIASSNGGGLFALPFSSSKRREKRRAANFKYLTTSGASAGNSWATGYRQQGTLEPPPRELVQNASLLLAAGSRPVSTTPAPLDYYYRRPGMSTGQASIRTSMTSSCGHHEQVYFPVLSSTSRLPTPAASPFPSVFSLQDASAIGTRRGAGGGGLQATRPSSGASAPSLIDSLRVSSGSGGVGFGGSGLGAGPVVGRGASRARQLPSQRAARLTSHKEEL